MFIRVGKPKNTKHWRLYGSGTKLLLPSLSSGFRHEERERERDTQFFCVDCFIWPNKRARAPPRPQLDWPCQVRKINSSSPNPNSLLLFKITKNPSPSLPGITSFTSPVYLLWHLWLSHPPRVRVNTCTQCVHLTKPCTKPKGSKLIKPKDKIYNTKNDNIKKILPQLYNTATPYQSGPELEPNHGMQLSHTQNTCNKWRLKCESL